MLKNLRIETDGNIYLKDDEEDICPICKAKIYATSYGQVGHY